MYTRTITYEDYNGTERTEKFYFNLTRSEITEMELGTEGGFADMLQTIVDANDLPIIVDIITKLILKSYGEKSQDGRRFMKTGPNGESLAEKFRQSAAYDDIYMSLITDAEEAARFINGISPVDIDDDVKAEITRRNQARIKAIENEAAGEVVDNA